MISLAQPTRVLVDPLEATHPAVEARRWLWPLLLLILCTSASATAFAVRWDAAPAVVGQLQAQGRLERMTEIELSEEIQGASRKALVAGIAGGVLGRPLMVLMLAAAMWLCAWLFDRSAPFARLWSAAALAMLPIALYHLIFTVCALAQSAMTLEQVPRLVPANLGLLTGLSPRMAQALGGVDFFNLWSVALLGLGFSAASGMSRGRAVLLWTVLYILFIAVVFVGLPGLAAAKAGGAS